MANRPLPPALVLDVVRAAAFAPSVLNTQPWEFVVSESTIDLRRRRDVSLPRLDPDNRELTISCGAALLNLRVAVAAAGWEPDVAILPDRDDPALIATVGLGEASSRGHVVRHLMDAIPRRRSSRTPFIDEPLAPEVVGTLERAAATEGALLRFVPGSAVPAVRRLVELADRAQRRDVGVGTDIDAWVRRPTGSVDGMPDSALGPRDREPSGTVRDFARGADVPMRGRTTFEPHPTLAILATDGDDPREWIRAGQALERVWLEATAEDLSVSLLTQPLELPNLRWLCGSLVGEPSHGIRAQAVLRIGIALHKTPHTPRRPTETVIRYAGDVSRASSSDGVVR
jgi:hypothetical protein